MSSRGAEDHKLGFEMNAKNLIPILIGKSMSLPLFTPKPAREHF
jgi:hypothetical protein